MSTSSLKALQRLSKRCLDAVWTLSGCCPEASPMLVYCCPEASPMLVQCWFNAEIMLTQCYCNAEKVRQWRPHGDRERPVFNQNCGERCCQLYLNGREIVFGEPLFSEKYKR